MNKKLILIAFIVMSSVIAHTFDAEVNILDDSNFVEKTGFSHGQSKPNDNWFVMLYAPWCGHCKKMIPTWSQLAKTESLPFKVAAVDCDKNKDIKTQFAIRGYPTLVFIDREGEVYKFGGPRDLDTFIEFGKNGYKAAEKVTMKAAKSAGQEATAQATKATKAAEGTIMAFVDQVGIIPIAVGVTALVVLVSSALFCAGGDDKKGKKDKKQTTTEKKEESTEKKEDKKRI